MWADAILGKAGELTSISSPLVNNGQALCFSFWFDIRVKYQHLRDRNVMNAFQQDAGIKYLKIESEVADDENSKARSKNIISNTDLVLPDRGCSGIYHLSMAWLSGL